jgi:hypothetical protein
VRNRAACLDKLALGMVGLKAQQTHLDVVNAARKSRASAPWKFKNANLRSYREFDCAPWRNLGTEAWGLLNYLTG